jgi:DMSO/TMAO reductase YedYZ molybdopterin-dependent catalytic subunit
MIVLPTRRSAGLIAGDVNHTQRKADSMRFPLMVVFIALLPFSAAAQSAADTVSILSISGDVPSPIKFTRAQLRAFPIKIVKALDHGKEPHEFAGVELYRLLDTAGIHFSDSLRGKTHASKCVIARAADGYTATFSMIELDPTFTDRTAIIAFQRDGAPLPENEAPLRIIVPEEKRHARWVRQLQSLIVKTIE